MDFKDIFNSFFRFDDTNADNFSRNDFNRNENNHPFDDDFGAQIGREFDDMFENFGQMFNMFNNFMIFDKNNIDFNDSKDWKQLETDSRNPRNLMLKQSDSESDNKVDIDLDEKVGKNGLKCLTRDSDNGFEVIETPIESRFIRQSFTYKSNNGMIEEKKVKADNYGNEETSVTHRIGDKSYTEVIKKNKNNVIEENKILSNMDENELKQFMSHWTGSQERSNSESCIPIKNNDSNKRNHDSLLNRFLSSWFQ